MSKMVSYELKDLQELLKELPKDKINEAYRLMKWLTAPDDQKYFWTKEWQQGEREADADIKAGRVKKFNNLDDAFKWLDSDESETWANEEKS
jgi:hypothetical protein